MRRPINFSERPSPYISAVSINLIPSERPVRSASSSAASGCLPCARFAEPWPSAGTTVPSGNFTVGVAARADALGSPTIIVPTAERDAPSVIQSPLNWRRFSNCVFIRRFRIAITKPIAQQTASETIRPCPLDPEMPIARLRIERLDQRAQRRPRHNPLHLGQKHCPPRRLGVALKPRHRQCQLLHSPEPMRTSPPRQTLYHGHCSWLLQSFLSSKRWGLVILANQTNISAAPSAFPEAALAGQRRESSHAR